MSPKLCQPENETSLVARQLPNDTNDLAGNLNRLPRPTHPRG